MNSTTNRQAIRTRRAIEQASDYTISRAVTSGEGAGFSFWVINPTRRKHYLVHQGTCGCPDFLNRCVDATGQPNGLKCKHIVMVEAHLGVGEALPADDTTPALGPVECPFDAEECAPPTLEEELRLGTQDEDRWQRIRRDRDALWPDA